MSIKKETAKNIKVMVADLNEAIKEAVQQELMVDIEIIDISNMGVPKSQPFLRVVISEEL